MRPPLVESDRGPAGSSSSVTNRAIAETLAVAGTALLHPVFVEVLGLRVLYIIAIVLAWSVYVAVRVRKHPEFLVAWGFCRRGLGKTMIAISIIFLVGAAVCAGIGAWRGSMAVSFHMLILSLLYPLWGTGQQFLVQALAVRNLAGFMPAWLVTLLAGILFGAVHLPSLELAAATLVMGLLFTPVYLRWRNLWPLGVCHGWLGILFYYWVLQRDPWMELFR
jgi:hypothetical protein